MWQWTLQVSYSILPGTYLSKQVKHARRLLEAVPGLWHPLSAPSDDPGNAWAYDINPDHTGSREGRVLRFLVASILHIGFFCYSVASGYLGIACGWSKRDRSAAS